MEDCSIELTSEFNDHQVEEMSKPSERRNETYSKPLRESDDISPQMMLELGFKVGDLVCASKKEKNSVSLKVSKIEDGKIHMLNEKLKQPADPVTWLSSR